MAILGKINGTILATAQPLTLLRTMFSASTSRKPTAAYALRGGRIGDFMISRVVVICVLALGVISPVFAGDCIRDNYGTVYCGRGDCLMDSNGKIHCARRGGGAIRDQYGNVVCGVGYCTADDTGRLLCSTAPAGNTTRDSYGKVTCEEGCQDAQAQLCEDLR